MDGTPPPTHHVLRPHHIGVLAIFILTYKEYESKPLPPPFVLHTIRLLLHEVSEVTQPRTFQELVQDLSAGPKADAEDPQSLIAALKGVNNDLLTADQMTLFFQSVQSLSSDRSGDGPPFTRHSIFGYFCRRCCLSFLKLSFVGMVKLQNDFQAWCKGDRQAGYEPIAKDQLDNGESLMFRTQADKKIWAQTDAYQAWEEGQAAGDENVASENLRRFFEQHFHAGNDSGIRQYALLHHIRMHYARGEYAAVEKLLEEAIAACRTSGDRVALQHCISIQNRLMPKDPERRPLLNDINPDLHPLEVLFDVRKLIYIPHAQPLSACFEKIVQAIGLYDHWADTSPASVEAEQWSQHATQSIVWSAAGCERLAAIEENIVTAFTDVASDDNNRLTVVLNRAYKRARQGEYEEGLCLLIDPDVWRGICFDDYVIWAREVWHILVLKASRCELDLLYRNFLRPRCPSGSCDERHYYFDLPLRTREEIRDPLYAVAEMMKCDQAAIGVEKLLTSLWHSEFQFRLNYYRVGIALLADVGMEFGMTERCRKILDEIMPQIIDGTDLELRALACFTLARCILSTVGDSASVDALREALHYLLTAESDFKRLRMLRQVMHVRYFLSIVYHNLGMEGERDDAIQKHTAAEEELMRLHLTVDDEAQRVWDVVSDVGAALASR